MKEINIDYTENDDSGFVDIVTAITNSVISQAKPDMVCIIQIDNWFDHKWLKFSGILALQLGCWSRSTTLPPFNPNRVQNQSVYERNEEGIYTGIDAPLIHVKQNSSANLDNYLDENTNSGMFIWWSGNSTLNGKASFMLYSQIGRKESSWYSSFDRDKNWKVNKSKCIPLESLKSYMSGNAEHEVPGADVRQMVSEESQLKTASRRVFKRLLKDHAKLQNI